MKIKGLSKETAMDRVACQIAFCKKSCNLCSVQAWIMQLKTYDDDDEEQPSVYVLDCTNTQN